MVTKVNQNFGKAKVYPSNCKQKGVLGVTCQGSKEYITDDH